MLSWWCICVFVFRICIWEQYICIWHETQMQYLYLYCTLCNVSVFKCICIYKIIFGPNSGSMRFSSPSENLWWNTRFLKTKTQILLFLGHYNKCYQDGPKETHFGGISYSMYGCCLVVAQWSYNCLQVVGWMLLGYHLIFARRCTLSEKSIHTIKI